MNKYIVFCCFLVAGTSQVVFAEVGCESQKNEDLKPTLSDSRLLGPGSGGTGGDDQECEPAKDGN